MGQAHASMHAVAKLRWHPEPNKRMYTRRISGAQYPLRCKDRSMGSTHSLKLSFASVTV